MTPWDIRYVFRNPTSGRVLVVFAESIHAARVTGAIHSVML